MSTMNEIKEDGNMPRISPQLTYVPGPHSLDPPHTHSKYAMNDRPQSTRTIDNFFVGQNAAVSDAALLATATQ